MLNREGWSLLAILLFFLALLGAGFAHMGRERSVADRLREGGGAADTAAGLVVAAGGVVLLAIVPGTLYLYGLSRLLMPLSLAAGACALLCGVLPRLRAAAPRALSAAELYSRASAPRAAFAVIGAMSALGLATGAIALLGRVIAGVFSLHQTLALGAAALLCAILALLCGPQSRRRMDRLQVLLLVGLLAALPASAVLHSGDNDNTLAAVLASAFSRLDTGNPVLVDMLSDLGWGLGVLGAVSLLSRATAVQEEYAARYGGRIGAALLALLTVLSAAAGLLGRMVEEGLTTLAAVLGAGLALRAFGRPTTVLGAWVSLAAGAGVVVAWTAVPALRNLGMLGALPSAGAVALVQWLLRPRRQEAPAPQPETVSEAPAPAEEGEAEPARSEGEENDGTLAL